MNRRDSLKSLFVGGLGSSLLLSCKLDEASEVAELTEIREKEFDYGRTPEEKEHDEELMSKDFYTEEEMAAILVLSDIIIPGEGDYPPVSKTEGYPEFIEFITKDIPSHKIPMRGGLRWLENESYKRNDKKFVDLSDEQRLAIIEDIAYPEEVKPEFSQGAVFFSRMRNLAATGYFTSKQGIDYLGYMGNRPNAWDGVPQDVLKKHGLEYDEKILTQSLKPEERNDIQDWSNYVL
ncbi:hypothetical protein GCM10023115_41250 [Pontixanthobacter gangjinensis]|uniref:Gluconate 2-dehydrogenase subunit 3 family protein n=1 Tax=Christiangramia aestuarii TaxID=1028746 RepID=A0A7K1LSL9_9FLAO|nr:gluconate 2-dehydrogenase subunit 3 family protein [Christiangramia aestuarii]MUP43490.1 gluconate 2-dehydrogenase subunit 3 family protein [Christiangramia aestuarii]